VIQNEMSIVGSLIEECLAGKMRYVVLYPRYLFISQVDRGYILCPGFKFDFDHPIISK
jgi:hypothetical protein